MIQTLTTKALRALRDSLKSWQDGYDPVDDKEQYEMFVTAETAVGELLANREAQPVAWQYRYAANGRVGEWRTVEVELHCNIFPEFERRPIFTAPPAVPKGWESCSPEWIERNGPCSCGEAPRIAFGSIGNHYHPHLWHKPSIAPVVNPEFTGATAVPEAIITAPVEAMRCGPAASYVMGWNACRAAMLAQPVSQGCELVPVEPTEEMIAAAMGISETAIAIYKRMLAAAPEGGNG